METTVVISNFNRKKYISEAIESVRQQIYKDWELIIIDDTVGGDGLKSYEDARTRVLETNDIGLSALRMFGAEMAKGKYILFMDADDMIHPLFLSKTRDLLESHPDVAFAYTDTQHFDGANSYWEQPEYNFHNLLMQNYICACSLIRKDTIFAVGGFNLNNFNYWEDYEFWIALGAKGYYGKHIAEKLYYYRIHQESGMQSKRNELLSPLYKAHIINRFSVLYPKEYNDWASQIILNYPSDIMKWKPQAQEKYLKERGLL